MVRIDFVVTIPPAARRPTTTDQLNHIPFHTMGGDSTVPDNDSSSTAAFAVIGNIENKDVVTGRCDGVGKDKDAEAVTRKENVDVDESGNDNADDAQFTTVDEKVTGDSPSKADGNLSPDSRKRSSNEEEEEEPLPTLPLKRARTAYFIFADEKRDEVKQQVIISNFIPYTICFYINSLSPTIR